MSKKDVDRWKRLSKKFRKSIKKISDRPLSREELVVRIAQCEAQFAEWKVALHDMVRDA